MTRFLLLLLLVFFAAPALADSTQRMFKYDLPCLPLPRFGCVGSFSENVPNTTAVASLTVAFSPGNAEQTVIAAIGSAHRSIHLAAYSFTSKPIAQALVDAKARGVEVEAVIDKLDEGQVAHLLPGIPVRIDRQYAIMHDKFLVIDGRTVETGSFNYSRAAGSGRNAENVVVLWDMTDVAARYEQEWHRMWNESEGM